MNNEKLRALIVDAVHWAIEVKYQYEGDAAHREALAKLESGHIYVGEWVEPETSSSQRGHYLCTYGTGVWGGEYCRNKPVDTWRHDAEGTTDIPLYVTDYPSPPTGKL